MHSVLLQPRVLSRYRFAWHEGMIVFDSSGSPRCSYRRVLGTWKNTHGHFHGNIALMGNGDLLPNTKYLLLNDSVCKSYEQIKINT